MTTIQRISPKPVVDSVKIDEKAPFLIRCVWKELEPSMEYQMKTGRSIDSVCDYVVRHGKAIAMTEIQRNPIDPDTCAKYFKDLFFINSFQNQSGAFIISMGYNCKPRLYDVQIKFRMIPGVCRKCGCTSEDCRACIQRIGSPCSWVEDDLCSACDTKDVSL